jgi:hypothetical protein
MSHTHLDSSRVRVPPTGKKSSPYPYPSGRLPDGYWVPVPELSSLDGIAKRIVGKTCHSVVSSVTETSLIPPELASIVSLKFMFVVVYNDVSFHDVEKELLIKAIITSHGRVQSLSSPQTIIPALLPSTPDKSRLSTSSFPGVSLPIYNSLSPLYIILHFVNDTMFTSHMFVPHYTATYCTEKSSSDYHIPEKSLNQLTIEPTFTFKSFI